MIFVWRCGEFDEKEVPTVIANENTRAIFGGQNTVNETGGSSDSRAGKPSSYTDRGTAVA
jgi:hypothetical protein